MKTEEQIREEMEEAALAAIELQNRAFREDFYLWCVMHVSTSDEATQRTLPFPADKAYLKDLAWILQHEPKVALPKSRRMFISWLVSLYCQWRARFHSNNAIFFQSETESKSAFIVDKRIKFVEDNLPLVYQKGYEELKTKSGLVGRITYKETGSYVWAIAQGDSQIRSYTPSILVMDEVEFHTEGPQALAAALATVEKSAQIILISTSNGPGHPLSNICEGAGFIKWKG
jgi:phage FluMu gp28-like protein